MTFILTVKTKDGIILAADSKEIIQGGYLRWEDFADLLNAKGKTEESDDTCLSPKEIAELIYNRSSKTDGRIVSFDGAKKIFKITSHTAILVAGKANPGGKEFLEIIQDIQRKINAIAQPTYDKIKLITFDHISDEFKKDGDDKFGSEQIFCGFDTVQNKCRTTNFFWDKRRFPDGQGVSIPVMLTHHSGDVDPPVVGQ